MSVHEDADRVAAEHAALEEAKRDKQLAKVELLRAVREAIRPALPALCSREGEGRMRVLRVIRGFCLDEQGRWVELREGGAWVLTDEEVARAYPAEDVVSSLSRTLSSHVGAREWSTTQIREEAERLRAAALVLAVGRRKA